jgi:hypothetical protein
MVGFAALSSLCHEISNRKEHKAFSMNRARKCLLGCIDDLALILNKALSLQPPDTTTIMQVVWNLLPMLDLVTGIRGSEDGTLMGLTSTASSLSNADAQGLLNSSLFREILFLYIATATSSSQESEPLPHNSALPTTSACYRPLGRSIVCLMALSPNILAKYAWRVPHFTSLVLSCKDVSSESLDGKEGVVDRLLWNLLGAAASTGNSLSASNPPKVVWKTKSPETFTTNLESCSGQAWIDVTALCEQCVAAMIDLKEIRLFQQRQQLSPSTPEPEAHALCHFKHRHQTTLQNVTFLTQLFQSCQPLAQAFLQTILIQSNKQLDFQAKLWEIQDAISQLPPPSTTTSATTPTGRSPPSSSRKGAEHDNENRSKQEHDDDDVDGDKAKASGRRDAMLWESHEDCVSQLRKAIKVMSSLLLSPGTGNNELAEDSSRINDESKIYQNIASKTD